MREFYKMRDANLKKKVKICDWSISSVIFHEILNRTSGFS